MMAVSLPACAKCGNDVFPVSLTSADPVSHRILPLVQVRPDQGAGHNSRLAIARRVGTISE